MLININFTVDIPKERLPELRKFMSCADNEELIYAIKAEPEQELMDYLGSNGFHDTKVVRRDGRKVNDG